ncbi:MAG: 2Fe-2S iron-sulfur cluster binding domain-containing protein [Gammaproteobacteria bacterium]|nr:2Fe-2S iron-sulfur cluster binding domain-containing protein [Gammaproteobacteria bacterium]
MSPAIKSLHRWLGLLVGAQALLWLLSGFVMALLPAEEISGARRFVLKAPPAALPAVTADVAAVLARYRPQRLRLLTVNGQARYELTTGDGRRLIDANDLEPAPLDEAAVRALALAAWRGVGPIRGLRLERERSLENRRHALPVWRVDFASEAEDRLYLDGVTGQILGAGNRAAELFDVFWMLHIMDYRARTDFNNPLVIGAAALAVLLSLSGAWLLGPVLAGLGERVRRRDEAPISLLRDGTVIDTVRARGGETVFELAERAGYPLPSSCGGGGSCGLCRVQLSAASPVGDEERRCLSEHELAHGWRLACRQPVRGASTLALPPAAFTRRWLKARVVAKRFLSPSLVELRLRLPEEAAFAWRPGEHVLVRSPAFEVRLADLGPPAPVRAYSIANAGDEPDELVLLVRLAMSSTPGAPLGRCSAYLASLRPGAALPLSGPYGNFHVRHGHRPLLLLGGGAGLGPLRSMLRDHLLVRGDRRPLTLWYGTRTAADLAYAGEFDALAQEHGQFRWHTVLSEEPADSAWRGARGLLPDVLASVYTPAEWQAHDIYLCGPPAMVAAVSALLHAAGVPDEQVFIDEFN